MIKTFTSEDVVRYFHGEVSGKEKQEIEHALAFDEKLQNVYCELEEGTRVLDSLEGSPSNKSIETILTYSKNLGLRN